MSDVSVDEMLSLQWAEMSAFTEATLAPRPSRAPDLAAEIGALRNIADELAERSPSRSVQGQALASR